MGPVDEIVRTRGGPADPRRSGRHHSPHVQECCARQGQVVLVSGCIRGEHMYAWGMQRDISELKETITVLASSVSDPAGVKELFGALDVFEAELCAAVGRLDRSGAVVFEGSVNTAQWLRTHAGRTQRQAAAVLKRAGLMLACPALGAAWTDGSISSGQMDVVAAK